MLWKILYGYFWVLVFHLMSLQELMYNINNFLQLRHLPASTKYNAPSLFQCLFSFVRPREDFLILQLNLALAENNCHDPPFIRTPYWKVFQYLFPQNFHSIFSCIMLDPFFYYFPSWWKFSKHLVCFYQICCWVRKSTNFSHACRIKRISLSAIWENNIIWFDAQDILLSWWQYVLYANK